MNGFGDWSPQDEMSNRDAAASGCALVVLLAIFVVLLAIRLFSYIV